MRYRVLINTLILIVIPFSINKCDFYVGSLMLDVEFIFVATLVKYFRSLHHIFGFCLIFRGFVYSFWGFE